MFETLDPLGNCICSGWNGWVPVSVSPQPRNLKALLSLREARTGHVDPGSVQVILQVLWTPMDPYCMVPLPCFGYTPCTMGVQVVGVPWGSVKVCRQGPLRQQMEQDLALPAAVDLHFAGFGILN